MSSLSPERADLPGAALVDQNQPFGRMEVIVVRDDGFLLVK